MISLQTTESDTRNKTMLRNAHQRTTHIIQATKRKQEKNMNNKTEQGNNQTVAVKTNSSHPPTTPQHTHTHTHTHTHPQLHTKANRKK